MGDAILLKCKCGYAKCGRELLIGKVTPVEFTLELSDNVYAWVENEVVTDAELSDRLDAALLDAGGVEDGADAVGGELWVNDDTLTITLPAQDLEELKVWAGL